MASIFDGRLLEKASKISSACSKPVLVVENPLHEALQWVSNRNAVYGALAAMAFSYGFTVFQTRDSEETAQLIAIMAKHGRYGNSRYPSPMVRGKPRGSSWQRQLAMVEAISWIGPRYAERLLRKLGSVRAVFNASQSQLTQAGIPPATASKIQRLLNAPYVKTRTGRQAEVEEYP